MKVSGSVQNFYNRCDALFNALEIDQVGRLPKTPDGLWLWISEWRSRVATAWFLSVVIFEKPRAGSNEQRARSRLAPLQQMPRADVSGSLPSCCLPPFSQLSAVSLF